MTESSVERVREWLKEAPFYDTRRLDEDFTYEDWLERGKALPDVAEALAEVLSSVQLDTPDNLNFGAAYALGWLGDDRAVAALLRALESPSATVRMQAVAALGRLNVSSQVDTVRARLEDPDFNVRANACIALGYLGGEEAVAALRRASETEQAFVAECAAEALRMLEAES